MKKLILLAFITMSILAAGCPNTVGNKKSHEQGNTPSPAQLKITNQSSRHIIDADYDSVNFTTGVFSGSRCLPIAHSCVKSLPEESNSYIRFTVYSKVYSEGYGWKGKKYQLRTSELTAAALGKTTLVTITDNTLVVVIGGSNTPVPLASLYEDATTVTVKNETSRMLKKVTFNETIFAQEDGTFGRGKAVIQSFTGSCESYVYFTIHEREHPVSNELDDTEHGDNSSCAVYTVRTREKFSVRMYESKEIVIDDTTQVVKIGETDDKSLAVSALIKNSSALKIENSTTRPLIRVKYGHTGFSTDSSNGNLYLPINAYDIETFYEEREEYITFTLPDTFYAASAGITVRTAEKIPLKKGTARTVTLTDSTMVVKEGENTPVVLSSLYYYKTQLTLTNACSRDIFSTGGTLILEKGLSKTTAIGYYGNTYNEPLKFVLYARSSNSGTAFTVRTKDSIELNSGGTAQSFTIDDNTMVIIEGTESAVTIASLLDNRPAGTLTVQNNTSRPLYSISFLSFPSFSLEIGESRIFNIETENDAAPITVETMYAKNKETVPYDSSVGVIQYTFKTDETIRTALGEAAAFTFTDSTQIIPAGTFTAVPLSSLLDSSPYGYLTIENNYSKSFYRVTWNGVVCEVPSAYYSYQFPPLRQYTIKIGGTDTVSSYISFYVGYQSDAPLYRTGDPVSVPAGTAVTYSISGNTMVVKLPGTAPPAPLSTLEH
ncbi:MAG: hypothetical protein P1P65_02220 [Treponema sp.]